MEMKKFSIILAILLVAVSFTAAYPTGWRQVRFTRGTPPTDLGGYTAVNIGRSIFFFGGIRDIVSPDGAWANEVDTFFNDVYEFDTTMRKWTKHSAPSGAVEAGQWPSARAFYAATASKADPNAFYIFGGATYDKGGIANYADFADLWKFDTVTKTWELIANGTVAGQPPALAFPAMFEANGKIYVTFGTTATRQSNGVMWSMDVVTHQWSQVDFGSGPAPHARFAAMVNMREETGTVISFGGETLQVTPTGMIGTNYVDVWEFNPDTETWTRIDDGSVPAFAPRAYSAHGISGGVLVVHGGSIAQPDDSDVPDALSTDETHFFDLESHTWHTCPWAQVAPVACSRRGPNVKRSAGAVIAGGRFVHFGGFELAYDADSGVFTQTWNNDMHEFLLPWRVLN